MEAFGLWCDAWDAAFNTDEGPVTLLVTLQVKTFRKKNWFFCVSDEIIYWHKIKL